MPITNNNGNIRRGVDPTAIIHAAEEKGIYGSKNRPFTDDPTAAQLDRFHDPREFATMANLNPQEASALAFMRSIGQVVGDPLLQGYCRNYALFTRSKSGHGAEQMADILRRTPRDHNRPTLRERVFGKTSQPPTQE